MAAMRRLRSSYHDTLDIALGNRAANVIVGGVLAVLAVLAVAMFMTLPRELVPAEDRGRVDVAIIAPEGTGYDSTLRTADRVEPILQQCGPPRRRQPLHPRRAALWSDGLQYRFRIAGAARLGSAQHKRPAGGRALNRQFNVITSARVLASVRGPFQRGGSGSGSNVDLIAEGNDYPSMARWIAPILEAAEANPGLVRPRLDYQPTSPRLAVNLNRDKAAQLGVSVSESATRCRPCSARSG